MVAPLATTCIDADGASPARHLYFLHGILGSRANWRSIARKLARQVPGWGMVLVDLRHHGESLEVGGSNTVAQAARDVLATAAELARPVDAVLGHSFGGKVALEVLRQAEHPPRATVVVDAMPGPASGESDTGTSDVLAALERAPKQYASRAAFIEHFEGLGFSSSLSAWLAMNLQRPDGDQGVRLPLDLAAIRELLEDYQRVDLWPTVTSAPDGSGLHLIVAGRSATWGSEARTRADGLSGAKVHRLERAGHWVHADDPDGLLRILVGVLEEA